MLKVTLKRRLTKLVCSEMPLGLHRGFLNVIEVRL